MTPEFQELNCSKCKYGQRTSAWKINFIGCTHKPYKGKWVAEIDECPKNVISMDNRRQYKFLDGDC